MSAETFYPVNQYEPMRLGRLRASFLDAWILTKRSLLHIVKNRDQVLGLTIQPIMFMILFRYVFGGAINTGPINYVNFLMGGILIQSVSFGSLTTSLSVSTDVQRGIIDRFKSLPIFGLGAVIGHVVADLARNAIQAFIMIGVGFLVGFRPTANVWQWLMIAGLVALYAFAISWVAAIIGLAAKSVEAVQWLGFLVVFPLTFASSAFVPTQSMPVFLRVFADNQPVTQVINAVRDLMNGLPMGNAALYSVLWSVGIIVVAVPIAASLYWKYQGK